ncbi:MAG: isoprenyl transferase [Parvibaculaceae bacterium]
MPAEHEGVALRKKEEALQPEPSDEDEPSVPARWPRHIAIIMDGNGRWAHARSLPRSAGHRKGVEAVRRTIHAALELKIECLTIFSFSSENWSRPASEVSDLLALMRRFVRQDVAELHAAGVQVRIIGEREGLTPDILSMIEETESLTRDNRAMRLNVAFNYGSRQELVSAVRRIAEAVRRGEVEPEEISPELIASGLYSSDVPDPDLLIRTSGEQRLSNFLLWQCAYAEFVFVEEHWPDFSKETLVRAIDEFRTRDRRFGGLTARAL